MCICICIIFWQSSQRLYGQIFVGLAVCCIILQPLLCGVQKCWCNISLLGIHAVPHVLQPYVYVWCVLRQEPMDIPVVALMYLELLTISQFLEYK